jgi:hypothetical protein
VKLRIEIADEHVVCYQDGTSAFSAPLGDFLSAICERSEGAVMPEAIPEGVRFFRARGQVAIVVLEDAPQVRTVRWLADDSPVPFGPGAVYRTARLAFPFVVTIVAFRAGGTTGYQQCFYRTEPLRTEADPLFFPNLYNVADGYGQTCWLCLANMRRDLSKLTWADRVAVIRNHLWGAGFNQSSEVHEGMSYWQAMRKIDPRLNNLAAWEAASAADPFFPLTVKWRPSGATVGQVIDTMFDGIGTPRMPGTLSELVQMLSLVAVRRRKSG